ncbi:MAG: Tol-Pal system beta propeller repeat protein TolB [Alphaproteobacteria bacterium]|nr:Tol-Pal system beta propeller repeat protein TolB [Alphaproteobacteria bacterium]
MTLKGAPSPFALLLLLVTAFVLVPDARAQLRVDITQGVSEPIPVAVANFHGDDLGSQDMGAQITAVIRSNLERSGLFRSVDPAAFIQDIAALNIRPRFADWRVIGAQALISGKVTVTGSTLEAEFRLWDIFAESQMTGLKYSTVPSNWRRIAHIISDAIYKQITGENGYFDTRIVYVSETGPQNRKQKRLAIMDQDGANHQYLTDGSTLVLTPRFSPTTQEITYLAYYNNKPRVYLLNIDTGQQEVVGDFPGMTFAPRFSPDGRSVIMSLAQAGNSDIYTMDLPTRRVRRLTNHPAIDTSASFSPDGQFITFNSDRGGSQQIYVMRADGSDVRRISFGDGRYATPVWSPRGDLIAFTKFGGGVFHIGVMRPDGSGERLLTQSFLDEAPTWAPNGRVLMFYRQTPSDSQGRGKASIWSVDLTGRNLREIGTPQDGSDPAWSPLIP